MSESKPYHNSGAELASRTDKELRDELRGHFPNSPRWQGITYELGQRADRKQERMLRWTLGAAIASVIVGIVSAVGAFI